VSKTTISGKMPSPPKPMTADQIERAARADRDARPLSEDDLKRMKRTPQAKVIRRVLVVPHDNGWAVKRPDAERSSAVTATQAEAIERAREIEPSATIRAQNRHGEFRRLHPKAS